MLKLSTISQNACIQTFAKIVDSFADRCLRQLRKSSHTLSFRRAHQRRKQLIFLLRRQLSPHLSSSSLFGMHHQCVAPLAASSLHSGLFRASSMASSKARLCRARSFFRVAIQEV